MHPFLQVQRSFRWLNLSHNNIFAASRISLTLASTPPLLKSPRFSACQPCVRAEIGRRLGTGTRNNPHNPHLQVPGKHIQMGENATAEMPFPLTEVDKWVLSQTDEEFTYHTWDELHRLIQNNQLSLLKRKPSDLRRYIQWTAQTKKEYGSITNYLLAHRLPKAWGSPPFSPASDTPFADPSDYRVLINDWPYGFAPGITHIVVWSRTPIPVDADVGDMTPESRRTVAEFIKRYFVDSLGPGGEDKVMWFKNWVALQSVRTVDHVHVLVRDVEPAVLQEWAREREWHRLQQ